MKSIVLLFSLFLIGMTNLEEKLLVKVNGLSSQKGQLMVAIYDHAEHFPKHDNALKQLIVKISSNAPSFYVTLPKNKKYAIAVYHDENTNRKLDKNFLGMPTEKYGFSNQARGVFGPPSFAEAAFLFLGKSSVSIKIE